MRATFTIPLQTMTSTPLPAAVPSDTPPTTQASSSTTHDDDGLPGATELDWQGLPSLLPADDLVRLTRPAPWRSLAAIAFDWLSSILVAAVALTAQRAWLWPLAWVWIGSRLHGLGVLAHDGAHGLLLPRRRLNDLVVELLLAWPILLSPASYRALHRGHHRHLNTDADPDWARNRPDELVGSPSWGHTLRVLLGLSSRQAKLVDLMKPAGADARPQVPPLRMAVLVVVVAVVAVRGLWLEALLVWGAPFALWFLPTMRLKGIAEHFAVANTTPLNAARTVLANPLERWLIAPHHVHFHLEHHLFPSIPCVRLPEAHAALRRVPAFVRGAHLTHGYLAFLRECLVARGATPRAPLHNTP
jgi:fatty acid desaturase